MAIPSNLYRKLRAALSDCGPFATTTELNTIFIEKRLSPWRNRLPEANNLTGRVESIIDFLYHQYDDVGKNALVLLLYVLSERLDSGDACYHRLADLANELEREVKRLDSERFRRTEQPIQVSPQDAYVPYQISKEDGTSKQSLTNFRVLMLKYFNEGELHDLCLTLELTWKFCLEEGKLTRLENL